jgi:hypothetical protein
MCPQCHDELVIDAETFDVPYERTSWSYQQRRHANRGELKWTSR